MKGLLIRGVNNKEELEMIYLDNKGDISQRRVRLRRLLSCILFYQATAAHFQGK